MKTLMKITKALSDPNRVKILKLLEKNELCVCEIQAILPLAQSTVSTHLKTLVDAELIEFRKDGLWITYKTSEIKNQELNHLVKNLLNYLENDKEIKLDLKKLKSIDRFKICRKKR